MSSSADPLFNSRSSARVLISVMDRYYVGRYRGVNFRIDIALRRPSRSEIRKGGTFLRHSSGAAPDHTITIYGANRAAAPDDARGPRVRIAPHQVGAAPDDAIIVIP